MWQHQQNKLVQQPFNPGQRGWAGTRNVQFALALTVDASVTPLITFISLSTASFHVFLGLPPWCCHISNFSHRPKCFVFWSSVLNLFLNYCNKLHKLSISRPSPSLLTHYILMLWHATPILNPRSTIYKTLIVLQCVLVILKDAIVSFLNNLYITNERVWAKEHWWDETALSDNLHLQIPHHFFNVYQNQYILFFRKIIWTGPDHILRIISETEIEIKNADSNTGWWDKTCPSHSQLAPTRQNTTPSSETLCNSPTFTEADYYTHHMASRK